MKHELPFRYLDFLTASVFKTGSSFTCDPPVLNTDEDYLVYVNVLDYAGYKLRQNGWKNCFEEWQNKEDTDPAKETDGYSVEDTFGARFQAWRLGKMNVILTDDVALYLRSVGATLVAKHLNLQDKAARIALFRCIKYGQEYSGELP